LADSLARAKARLRTEQPRRAFPAREHSQLRRVLSHKWTLRILVWGGLLVAWQVTAIVKGPLFHPLLQDTVRAFGSSFENGYYMIMLESLKQMIIGFFVACLAAIPLGALMGRFRVVEDLFAPYVNTLFVTSREALLPLLVIAFGTGLGYRVAVVVLFAFFFPVMNTAAGVRFVDKDLIQTAQAFCTSPWRMFSQVYLPAAAPFVVAGVRLGLGMALKGFVIAEIWVILGTGELLVKTGGYRQLDIFFSLALVISAIGVGANEAMKALERRLRPWAHLTAHGAAEL
jgi:ABC-type nitrate/sulfonate/bicarbonate transport system permease component